ncbi:hypothetical protein OROGR_005086 [Orobanche gracilis]
MKGILLPKVSPFLYSNGGPIIMVQVENEFGSYGDDKAYLHYLVELARKHLGNEIILYIPLMEALEKLLRREQFLETPFSQVVSIFGPSSSTLISSISVYLFSPAVDFSTGEDPEPIFNLQKEFNAPGKSPPLSAEFYTGWLTHWGENIASMDATFTASNLEKILSKNGSAVLYMAHGGTNFGFYNGANTGSSESDYKADLTSYDYDAPIRESGDVDNAKYKALRGVIAKYTAEPLASIPPDNEKIAYGRIELDRISFLLDMIGINDFIDVVESKSPMSMEAIGQMFGFVLYASDFTTEGNGSVLFIPKVHDRAQVFVSCPDGSGKRPTYIDVITRWSNRPIDLPYLKCASKCKLFILDPRNVENMGRLNYGPYLFDRKGILSPVYLDERPLYNWKMLPVFFRNLIEARKNNPIVLSAAKKFLKESAWKKVKVKNEVELNLEPAFYAGHFSIDKVGDTYISFSGWSKGVAFVNEINVGRFWPSVGPQCNLYVPAPILRLGDNNTLVILELESPNPDLFVRSVDQPDFSCRSKKFKTW